MSRITALKSGKRTDKKVNMYLDGKFIASLDKEVAVREKLAIGQEVSSARIADLVKDSDLVRCLDAAYSFLSYRPRSEAEVKERLLRRGFEISQIEIVLKKLKEQKFLDDTAFAQFWKDNREAFRPRSRRLTGLELRKKGVAGEIIDGVIEQIDDVESAYQAALMKAKRLPKQDYEVFYRRLGDYLRRRGFDYAVINQTVKRLWQESAVRD